MPAAASSSPARTFSRLVLPAPLRPTRPTLSPAATVNEASLSTRLATTSMARFRTWSTATECYVRGRPSFRVAANPPEADMKKVLVVIAILMAAAACGESTAAHSSAGGVAVAPAPNTGKGTVGAPGQDYGPNQQPVPVQGPLV